MTYLIDASLWVDFLRRGGSDGVHAFIKQALREQSAAYACVTAMELLAGCRNREEQSVIRELLGLSRHLAVEWPHWELAADMLKHLYKSGNRVPLSDVLAAAVAVDKKITLACRDKHFEIIRKHGGHSFEFKFIE